MKKFVLLSIVALLFSATAHADFVILRDGKSYSGAYTGAPNGKLSFKDNSGIQYTFPLADVQSLVFSNVSDHISLRGGQSYTGQLIGVTTVSFRGSNGVSYVFPMKDIASMVFTHSVANGAPSPYASGAAAAQSAYNSGATAAQSAYNTGTAAAQSDYSRGAAMAQNYGAPSSYMPPSPSSAAMPATAGPGTPSLVIPSGTQIVVRTDVGIDTAKDAIGKLYPARIEQSVIDSTGSVGIPQGTGAQLQVVDLNQGTNSSTKDLALALYSVDLNGTQYRVDSSSVMEKNSAGFGMNKRTAEFAGGGAGLGAILGAVFGGGRGAGIGALAGGGMGALGQFLTRGKRVNVPAESTLTFQLDQTMVLHP